MKFIIERDDGQTSIRDGRTHAIVSRYSDGFVSLDLYIQNASIHAELLPEMARAIAAELLTMAEEAEKVE